MTRVFHQTLKNRLPGDGLGVVVALVQHFGLWAQDVERRIGAFFLACRGLQHRQIQVVQRVVGLFAHAGLLEIGVHQIQLLVDAQAQDGFGLLGKAHGSRASGRAVTKLDDAVAAFVGGFGVEAIALHQAEAGKVVGVKLVFGRQLKDLVVHRFFLMARNKAFGHGPVEGLLEHRVSGGAGVVVEVGFGRGAGVGAGECGRAVGHGWGTGLALVHPSAGAVGQHHRRGQLAGACRGHGLQFGVQGVQLQGLARVDAVGVCNAIAVGQVQRHAVALVWAEGNALAGRLLPNDAGEGLAGGNLVAGGWDGRVGAGFAGGLTRVGGLGLARLGGTGHDAAERRACQRGLGRKVFAGGKAHAGQGVERQVQFIHGITSVEGGRWG